MDNKKRNIVLTLIVLLAIGFASVSSVLVINGLLAIGENSEDFKIIFTSASIDGAERNDVISESKTEISYETKVLSLIDEESTLEYEATNTSRNYDADVQIVCNIVNEDENIIEGENEYIDMSYTPESMELLAGETKQGSITAKLKKAVTEPMDIHIKCTLNGTAKERDELPTTTTTSKVEEGEPNFPEPDLGNDKLIPINLANDGTVTVANTEEEWYDYDNKEWANAIILIDSPSKIYNVGDVVLEDDIESYFVWIPRYRYQIFDDGNYTEAINDIPIENGKEIQIEFETNDVTPSTGSTKGSWLTHPAFTNFNVNGLWVGKFETGYDYELGGSLNWIQPDRVLIKPNVRSWKKIAIKNIFMTAYNYERDLDSHMMKNTEWGAAAYLSHSKYGINTEVRINNNSNYLTGYAGFEKDAASSTDESKTLPYNTETGYLASTTGNITGIYDMSGGVEEYVAGYKSGQFCASGYCSGFTAEDMTTYEKYIDAYSSESTLASWNNRILGDATGEMGHFYSYKGYYKNSWYNDNSSFLNTSSIWFTRGGMCGMQERAGQFCFRVNLGKDYDQIGFRVVLAPTN